MFIHHFKKEKKPLTLIQVLLKFKRNLIPEKSIVAFDLFKIMEKICIHTSVETIMYNKYWIR